MPFVALKKIKQQIGMRKQQFLHELRFGFFLFQVP